MTAHEENGASEEKSGSKLTPDTTFLTCLAAGNPSSLSSPFAQVSADALAKTALTNQPAAAKTISEAAAGQTSWLPS